VIEGPDGALWGITRFGGWPSKGGVVYKVGKDGRGFQVMHYFGSVTNDGLNPTYGALTIGTNNWIYGTTGFGGRYGAGTVFRMQPDGTGYEVLIEFGGNAGRGPGIVPRCRLVIDAEGVLYGTTMTGLGTIFSLHHDGTNYRVVWQVDTNEAIRVGTFQAGVIVGSDGWLYGTSQTGGLQNPTPGFGDPPTMGTVYRVRRDGSNLEILHLFQGSLADDGYGPRCPLFEASDGKLYGTTVRDGLRASSSQGTVFRLERDGSGYEIIHRFSGGQGTAPHCDLIEGPDGTLYGQTSAEAVFKLAKDGAGFMTWTNSGGSFSGVTLASDGRLYGANFTGVFGLNTDGTGFTWLHRFGTFPPESSPRAPLVLAPNGDLLGTTDNGGRNSNGILFVITEQPNYLRGIDPANPPASPPRQMNGLVAGTDGFLYGTSQAGGSSNLGAIFRIAADGYGLTNLYSFGGGTDGRSPRTGLVSGRDGFLYGTAYLGGSFNRGTIFRIGENGSDYSILRHLGATMPDGQSLLAPLVVGPDQALYGAATGGGSANRGIVFCLKRDGGDYSILRHFLGGNDGASPQGPLLAASDGFLYGTTTGGGEGFGTIFRLRPDGADYQVIYRMRTAVAHGQQPRGPLIEKPRGVLWGCTLMGGTNNAGVLFRARMDGTDYRLLHLFGSGTNDGRGPYGGLTIDAKGWAIGTTMSGGSLNSGTYFRFNPNPIVLRVDPVGLNAVVTWEASDENEPDEVETAVSWLDGQPVWEGFGADIEMDGYHRRSVLPLQAVSQLLFRVKRGP
jgi:uncharacterized repeat protein (TIGR03803 family)